MRRSEPALLFVARRAPFPLTSGGRIRAHRLLTGLAKQFDTTFITFEHHPRSPDGHLGRDELTRLLPGIRVVTVQGSGPGKRGPQLRSLLTARSWEFGRYRLPALRAALEAHVPRDRGAILHLDDLAVAQFAPVRGALNVYSAHNVEYRILDGTTQTSRGHRRHFAQVERPKVEREERKVWRSVDLCLAVSDVDATEMRAAGARVGICPNGTDPVEQLAFPTRQGTDPLRILFVGSVAYRPNHRGLEWFIDQVLPELRISVPAELDIVGTPPRSFSSRPGVVVHGAVDSLTPFYERCHVAIVPVLYGSGTRLKILEAMAYGRPVVSTSIGAEGLPIVAGDHYVRADDAPAFTAALTRIAALCSGQGAELERMLARARGAVEAFFWPSIAARLARVYADEIAESERRKVA